jgi:para-aminobenzoate synthetase/4-amino-4-deoxychorismate lyase
MDSDRASRVRLLVDETGRVRTESVDLGQDSSLVRACIATEPIDESDVFFFHKTTRRPAYETRRCPHCEDVILWNSRGEVTESMMANVVVELDGQRLTPPVASGLLAGTLRERLLQEGCLTERIVTRADLRRAARVWLINSVRGWREVTLQRHADRQNEPAGREGEALERQVV